MDEGAVQLLKVKAILRDGSVLYLTELHTLTYQKYSYHWQSKNEELLLRWDNAPHFKELKTFPHHRHEGDKIMPSHRITADEVIEAIKRRLR